MEWRQQSQSVVLCEGYYDRAFWDGFLAHVGCTDPGERPGIAERLTISDPWGKPVTRGQYGYASKSGQFVRVLPCRGKENLLEQLRLLVRGSRDRPLRTVVINNDPDTAAGDSTGRQTALQRTHLLAEVKREDRGASRKDNWDVQLTGGGVIALVRWECDDAAGGHLPNQQTLERLVCAALCAAYPERAKPIEDWLASRGIPADPSPKAHAWSHMAGWYSDGGCEFFYQRLWDDPIIVAELRPRLVKCKAWKVAETLAE